MRKRIYNMFSKIYSKNILIAAAVLVFVSVLTGCSSSAKDKQALAVVVGMHANAPMISVESPFVKQKLMDCALSFGDVSFFSTGGPSKMFFNAAVPKPNVSGEITNEKRQAIAEEYTRQLITVLKSDAAIPTAKEVDTYSAIILSAQQLASSDAKEKSLLILDSGLCTMPNAYIDFSRGDIFQVETEKIIEALIEQDALPNLKGVQVYWAFCGQTAAPQPELSEMQKQKVKEIYRKILIACGADEVTFSSEIAAGDSLPNLPSVSLVPVQNREIDFEVEADPSETTTIDPIILNEIAFIGNTSNFVDEQAAKQTINAVAAILQTKDAPVYLLGTTASGGEEFCRRLSEERAVRIKAELVHCGIDEEKLIAVGLGFNDPFHVPDLDPETGRLIEEAASKNRVVRIFEVSGKEGALLTEALNP